VSRRRNGAGTAIRSLVVTTWFPDSDRPDRAAFCLAHVRALVAAGVELHVIHVRISRLRRADVTESYQGVRVRRLTLSVSRPWTFLRVSVAIWCALRDTDVLHSMAFSAALVTAPAWTARRRPWVHTEHWNGVVSPGSVGRVWRTFAFSRHVLRLPGRVTAVTDELARAMGRFTRANACAVVPCVVDPPPAIAPFPEGPTIRVIGVGLLIPRKDPLLAVDTIAWLVSRGHDVTFTWVGFGPLEDQVRQRAAQQGVADRVRLRGLVPPEEVMGLVAEAHLFFVPTHQENFFTAAAEAIAAGRPVVLPRSGGYTEYCREENAVLVDSLDPRDLGSAVLSAAARFARVDPVAVSETVARVFSTPVVGEAFLRIYRDVLRP
jgi:glycosyltransferase involved in cell wall biosynthesis